MDQPSQTDVTSEQVHTAIPAGTKELPGIKTLLYGTWSDIKARQSLFLTIVALLLVCTVVQQLPVLFSDEQGASMVSSSSSWMVLLLSFAGIVGSFLLYVVLFQVITHANEQAIGSAFANGKKYWLALLWVSFLECLMVSGGFLLLIIPGILLGVWVAFGQFILFSEDKRGIDALAYSREYVRGVWGSVFFRFFVLGVLVVLVSIAAQILLSISLGVSMNQSGAQSGSVSQRLIFMVLLGAVTTSAGVFAFVYMGRLYAALKASKGAIDESLQQYKKTKRTLTLFGWVGVVAVVLFFALIAFLISVIPKGEGSPYSNPESMTANSVDVLR